MEIDRQHLPADPVPLRQMVLSLLDDLDAKERKLQRVLHWLTKLLRCRYGPQRERVDEHQLFLFAAAAVETHRDGPPRAPAGAPAAAARTGHGRQRLPQHLERRHVSYELPPEQRQCPHCQAQLQRMGAETSERLEYAPAAFYVIAESCARYVCPKGCTVRTAEKPMQPIEKGLPGPGLLAHVATSKYADHLPLHRQAQMFTRQGVDLSRQTLCDWMRRSAELVAPLCEVMQQRVLRSHALQTDDHQL